ncbi:MAG: hypothetical protein P1U63_06545 [Coxiellaceae bacterium]|nr:hypothetical protein [Coxiellaceae bacterium]
MPSLKPLVSDAASHHVYNNVNLLASAAAFAAFAYQQFVKQADQLNYMNTANKVVFSAFAAVAVASAMQLIKQVRDTTAQADSEANASKTERFSRFTANAALLGAAGVASYAYFKDQNLLNLTKGLHVAVLSTLATALTAFSVNTVAHMKQQQAPSKLVTVPTLAAAVTGFAFVGFNLFNLEDKGFKTSGKLADALGYEGLASAGLFVAASLAQYALPLLARAAAGCLNGVGACAASTGGALSSCRDAVFNRKVNVGGGTGGQPLLSTPTAVVVDSGSPHGSAGSPVVQHPVQGQAPELLVGTAPRPGGGMASV